MIEPVIQFKQTTFSPSPGKHIIHHVSTTIHHGEFVVILGGNGSGKSTLLKLMNRNYFHTSGEIIFKNKLIESYDYKTLRDNIATITQQVSDSLFLDLTIEENAILINAAHEKKESASDVAHYLSQFNPKLSHALKTRVKNLSGGEQQLLAFALYLRHQPDLLLLDEHTSALDPKKSDDIMALTQAIILKKGITCLMTTHELNYALKYGNRLIALRDGEIVFDANQAEKATLTLADLLKYCY